MGHIAWYEFNFSSPVVLVTTVGARAMSTQLIEGKFSLSQNCALITPRDSNVNIIFFMYVFQQLFAYERGSISLIMQPSLRFTDLGRFYVPSPPLSEQAAIVRFLDHTEHRIKSYIRAKQKLIKLLNEQKKVIIHQAVTRGLDPNVRLKPSGVELLGNIPDHWAIKPLKRWVTFNSETLSEQTDKNYSFKYIDIGTIETGHLIHPPIEMNFEKSPSRARRILHFGDTIISTVRTYLKAIWYVNDNSGNLIASTGFAVLTPRKEVEPEYLDYVLQSPYFVDKVSAFSTGTTYPAISETILGCFVIALPPSLKEQKDIVNSIKSKTGPLEIIIKPETILI